MSRASSGNNHSRNKHKEPEDISLAESDNTTDNTESEDNIKPYKIDNDRGSVYLPGIPLTGKSLSGRILT